MTTTNGKHRDFLQTTLAHADVTLDGNRPWDIKVNDERFYARIIAGGSLAFGESYVDGWWDCPAIDQLVERLIRADLQKKVTVQWDSISAFVGSYLLNKGSRKRAFNIGERHYDIGNDVFQAMLDKRLIYTCGYWASARTLDEAQEAKLDLVCKKINLKPGQKVLDIGCGWGSFAKFAAEKYGAHIVGVTVSKEQVELGNKLCKGLPVEIRLMDYRDVNEKFDHIVSLGMFEHVGKKHYRTYMKKAYDCLKDDGTFLLHTIGSNSSNAVSDPWVIKYIFPGGYLPGISDIGTAIEGLFIMEDWHNFGTDYNKTLRAWFENFDKAWPQLKEKYDERFYRMWKYYLLACAGSFNAREIQLWQVVLTKREGAPKEYRSIR